MQRDVKKLYLVCPFCLAELDKWKLVKIKPDWKSRIKVQEQNVKEQAALKEYESKVLMEHLPECPVSITEKAKEFYACVVSN